MPTRKITLKFSLGDKVRSRFYEKTGVVIQVKYLEDVRLVAFLPGFVTDLKMNLLTLESLKLGDLLEALDQEEK